MGEAMTTRKERIARIAAENATHMLGLVPHLGPLAAAVGPFGLDPRLRELVALAVARANGCRATTAVHQAVGRLAGLTEAERLGETKSLTAGERSAIVLGLASVRFARQHG